MQRPHHLSEHSEFHGRSTEKENTSTSMVSDMCVTYFSLTCLTLRVPDCVSVRSVCVTLQHGFAVAMVKQQQGSC